jgi:lysine/ornithine N-monooxygenase
LHQWQQQFAALEIPHLRSPAVHQPDPDPHALRTFAAHRHQELFQPYDLPGTRLFQDFCQEVIRRWQLENCIYPDRVTRIEPISSKQGQRWRLWLASGATTIARRVVLANSGAVPNLPNWVDRLLDRYPQEKLQHSSQIDLRSLHSSGETVLIVGGGLTSGHLAMGAIARGAKVLLITRRSMYAKLFDADPGWLGPKYLKGFHAEADWEKRWHAIVTARNGGSFTPSLLAQIRQQER